MGITYNLSILGFFKYFNFAATVIERLIQSISPEFILSVPLIPLPIGISFFTFQILSYVIDVYRGRVEPQKSFVNLALYIMLFPQLIAGPIVRYITVERQIVSRHTDAQRMILGTERFILGLGKKVLLSNPMGSIANFAFDNPGNLNTMTAWIGIIAYTLQIYYDFSGYSDIAIGIGKILGFDFLENFNYPYIARSVQEFWRRWHISLSSWFKDYLYIPLGGSRKTNFITYRNLFIVFFLTGLWHGASWNFVVWGLFHGTFLILERVGLTKILHKIPPLFSWIYTMLVVMIGWVFFRAPNLGEAISYIETMFQFQFDKWYTIVTIADNEVIFYFAAALCFSFPIFQIFKNYLLESKNRYVSFGFQLFLIFTFGLSVCYIAGSEFNPFIYFIF